MEEKLKRPVRLSNNDPDPMAFLTQYIYLFFLNSNWINEGREPWSPWDGHNTDCDFSTAPSALGELRYTCVKPAHPLKIVPMKNKITYINGDLKFSAYIFSLPGFIPMVRELVVFSLNFHFLRLRLYSNHIITVIKALKGLRCYGNEHLLCTCRDN